MKKINKINFENIAISIAYNINSCIGLLYEEHYCQRIKGTLTASFYGEDGKIIKTTEIGQLKGTKVLVWKAINNGVDIFDVFDTERNLLEIGEKIWDFEGDNFLSQLDDFYGGVLEYGDVLVLDRIETISEYRGHDLGKYWIKNFYNNFCSETGIFVLKNFPLQHENNIPDSEKKEWQDKMEYHKMDQDFDASDKKLFNYYKRLGFKKIPSIDDLLFINPIIKNKLFSKIPIDVE